MHMSGRLRCFSLLGLVVLPAFGWAGCQAPGRARDVGSGNAPSQRRRGKMPRPVMAVHCIYDLNPWLNLDRAGDRDPEGIRYRVFLDLGTNETVLREGTFHIELYRIDRTGERQIERTLVNDWRYPTTRMPRIAKPGLLGPGYFFHLRWSDKSIAGQEIEINTVYEDSYGRTARSATKRFRVPKYST